jgi:hypothetical protein
MRKITGLLAAGVLFLAACGDDDDNADDTAVATEQDDGGAAATGVQADAAEEIIRQADEGNLDPDEDCIREKAAGLTDEDAQKIVDAGSDTPDLSPEGLAIVGSATTCLSGDAFIDSIVEGLPEDADADCVREKLQDADFGAIMETGTMPPELEQAVTDCGAG